MWQPLVLFLCLSPADYRKVGIGGDFIYQRIKCADDKEAYDGDKYHQPEVA